MANRLNSGNLSIYLDDRRGVSAGVKLAEADLIGISSQVIVSPRLKNSGDIEVRDRKSNDTRFVSVSNDFTSVLNQIGLSETIVRLHLVQKFDFWAFFDRMISVNSGELTKYREYKRSRISSR